MKIQDEDVAGRKAKGVAETDRAVGDDFAGDGFRQHLGVASERKLNLMVRAVHDDGDGATFGLARIDVGAVVDGIVAERSAADGIVSTTPLQQATGEIMGSTHERRESLAAEGVDGVATESTREIGSEQAIAATLVCRHGKFVADIKLRDAA